MAMLKTFLALGFLAVAAAQGGNGTSDCNENKADIVFVLDSSYSEGSANFKKQLAFVENFTKAFDIGPDHTQVSVVVFSSYVHNAFFLNAHQDKAALLAAIRKVSYSGGSTNTDDALKYVRENSLLPRNGARYGVPKIVIVLTDGQSSDPSGTATQAEILHLAGIQVISIGIGNGVKSSELQAIASDKQHAFNVSSFDALQTIQTELQTVTCKSEKVECDTSNADIVFLLDASGSEGASNFQRQLDFVANFTQKLNIGPQNVQISVITFGTSYTNEFFLNTYDNKMDVLAAINNVTYTGGSTNTAAALKFARENSFKPENGGRSSVPKLAIVLTDGHSISSTRTASEASLLHGTGTKVISIGIGSGISQTELNAIASDARHVFTVANFNALNTIQAEVDNEACTTPSACGTRPADIVFILDSSSSEGSANFKKQLDFVANFVKQFDVGPSDVQFGVVSYSSFAHNDIYLNSHSDKYALLADVLSIRYHSGSTSTDQGLRYARYYQFIARHGARVNASKIAIVLTDGRSDSTSKTIQEAQELKKLGVKIISVGIGANINQYELGNIATDRNHVYLVGSFDILQTIQDDIKDETCGDGSPQPTASPVLRPVDSISAIETMIMRREHEAMERRRRESNNDRPLEILRIECGKAPADIMFVLDSSASEGFSNFQKQLDFVRDFAYQFQIGPNDVQVGMVTFSSSAHEQFPLNKYHDQASLLAAISKVTYNSGTTHTDEALSYVRTTSFTPAKGDRANATNIVVVITDGQSTNPSKTLTQANMLKNMTGTKVISIGIGSGVNHQEIENIASDADHALAVANFNALQTISSELTYVACQTCGFINKADIVFLLDASSSEGPQNFQKQLDFISRVTNDFRIGPNHVQIGVITFSDFPNSEFFLNTYSDKGSILSAIQRIGYLTGLTNTDEALKFARQTTFTAHNGARDDATKYLIVLTDGASANVNLTLQEAELLKKQHIVILTIGIGSNINKPELEGMASDLNHVFEVSNFDALKTIRTDIKVAACEAIVTTTAPTTTTTQPTTTPEPFEVRQTTTAPELEVRQTTTTAQFEVRRTTTAPQFEVRQTTTAPQFEAPNQ